ncbi:hypothetical protein [Tsukamurella soli]|uniref:Uncharacterized protein n=1 Tax=Tsukamurella soli TaxID=644556 RepID=A0ABP8JQR7_9ACTN
MGEIREYLEAKQIQAQAAAEASGADADRATVAWYRNTLRHLDETETAMTAIREQVLAMVPVPPTRDVVTGSAIAEALEQLLAEVRAAAAAIPPPRKTRGNLS